MSILLGFLEPGIVLRVWHTIKKTFCDIEDVVIRLLCEPKTEKTPRSKARNHLGQQSEPHPGITPIIILLTFSLFIFFAKSDLLAMISNLSSENCETITTLILMDHFIHNVSSQLEKLLQCKYIDHMAHYLTECDRVWSCKISHFEIY